MTTPEVLQLLVALGVGAVVTELLRSVLQRKHMNADAAKVITDAATSLLQPLQHRVRELEDEIVRTRSELEAARAEVRALRIGLADDRADRDRRRSDPL